LVQLDDVAGRVGQERLPAGAVHRRARGDLEPTRGELLEHGVEVVVVGLPVSLDGTEGSQAAAARAFAGEIAARLDVPVETYDERLTTKMAAATRRGGSRASEDSLAAAHLLEGWLLAREARR